MLCKDMESLAIYSSTVFRLFWFPIFSLHRSKHLFPVDSERTGNKANCLDSFLFLSEISNCFHCRFRWHTYMMKLLLFFLWIENNKRKPKGLTFSKLAERKEMQYLIEEEKNLSHLFCGSLLILFETKYHGTEIFSSTGIEIDVSSWCQMTSIPFSKVVLLQYVGGLVHTFLMLVCWGKIETKLGMIGKLQM